MQKTDRFHIRPEVFLRSGVCLYSFILLGKYILYSLLGWYQALIPAIVPFTIPIDRQFAHLLLQVWGLILSADKVLGGWLEVFGVQHVHQFLHEHRGRQQK